MSGIQTESSREKPLSSAERLSNHLDRLTTMRNRLSAIKNRFVYPSPEVAGDNKVDETSTIHSTLDAIDVINDSIGYLLSELEETI